jgi:hypothetical protein
MIDLRLCAERMNIANTFPLKPIVKESRNLRPPATSPSRLMTKRNKTLILLDYNRNHMKSHEQSKAEVRQSPVLSAPLAKRSDQNGSHQLMDSSTSKKEVVMNEINV